MPPVTPPATSPARLTPRLVTGRAWGLVSSGLNELDRRLRPGRQGAAPPITNPADADVAVLLHRRASEVATALDDPRLGTMFEQQMLNTWQTTLRRRPGGRTFVITGDIPAMWLRDSSAQLRPFLLLATEAPTISSTIAEVVAQQWDLIAVDPYANAFNPTASGHTWHVLDLPADPRVWERKYEIDSLAFPVQLAWQLWQATGSRTHLTEDVHRGLRLVVETWQREQQHERDSSYRFVRPGTGDTLPRRGRGGPVATCGLTWSGFRPSDDPCRYGYNIPAQLMAVHALHLVADLAGAVFHDSALAGEAQALGAEIADAVAEHGVTQVDGLATWAYEVDGLGGVLVADDANMPSLLSLPLTGGIAIDDPLYLSTREFALSPRNPWFHQGRAASGIGSPHTPPGYIWPIALAVQALTSTERAEQLALLRTLVSTDAGTGLMHEGFDANDPSRFTRPWFSWANSMFCELVLTLSGTPSGPLAPGAPSRPAPGTDDIQY